MNREIKFRAISPVNTDESKSMQYYDLSKIDDLNRFASDDWAADRLMQFTGLHDKNDNEIYEGDICKFFNRYNNTSYTRVVRYCPNFASFGLYPNMTEVWQYESDWLKITEIEVIGNIHENPELLP